MRPIALLALASLALAPAALAQPSGGAAAAQCKDSQGRTVACAQKPKSEVQVEAPLRKPPPDMSPTLTSPDSTIPAMATAQCRDGTFSTAPYPTASCALHGGVQQWMH
jgi:hypothetical protein